MGIKETGVLMSCSDYHIFGKLIPTEVNLDLDRYQVKYRTIVYDNQGQDTGYRVYELDDELYFAHYRADGSLEYLFQASPEVYW